MSDPAETGPAGVLATLRAMPNPVRFLELGVFVNQAGAFLQAFLVLYLVHRGFSIGQAGTALATYGAGSVVGLLFGGGFTDRLGPRTTIIGAMSASAALTVSVSFLSSYAAILAVVAAAGATTQSYRPAASAMLARLTTPEHRVMVFAVNRLAVNLGALAGPLIAAGLASISWNLIFWGDGATSVAYALIAVFLLPRQEKAAEDGSGPAARPRLSTRVLLADRRFTAYLFMIFVNAVVYIQMMAVLPLSVRRAGHPTVVYSTLLGLSAAMLIALELLVTTKVQTWLPRRAAALGFVLLGAGLVGFGLPGGVPVLVAAMIVATFGEMVGGPMIFAWPAEVAPEGAEGRYLGTTQAMFGLGQAVGPLFGVALWESVHGRLWAWCGVGSAVCVAAAWYGMHKPASGGADSDTDSADADTANPDAADATTESPQTAASTA